MKIPNRSMAARRPSISLARIVSEDSQHADSLHKRHDKSSKDS